MLKRIFVGGLLVVVLSASVVARRPAASQGGQSPSVSPEAYKAPPLSAEAKAALESKLAGARARYEKNPDDAEAIIWLGRRTAYLGRFDEAIEIFTKGIGKHPRDARMYRHRGHRYLTTRRFDEAVKDFERAARLVEGRPDEVEPDGMPNERGVPTSTLNSNIFYHLGLAHYLKGDFKKARRAYRECLKFSKNPDMLAATTYWLYMTLRRLKREGEARAALAAIRDDAEIIENHDYQRLLLMFKGRLTPDQLLTDASKAESSLSFASIAYGVGNWFLYTGRRDWAMALLVKAVNKSPQRTSFGYIAAEAELRRMGIRVNAVDTRPKSFRIIQ